MEKAQKGDLIRIVKEKRFESNNTEDLLLGAIYEVDYVDREGDVNFIDNKGDHRYLSDHTSYEIHRKAGEEDSAIPKAGPSSENEKPIDLAEICRTQPFQGLVHVDTFPWEDAAEQDAVNPQHYKQGRVEVIDIIEDAVEGADPFEAVCQANVLKYALRYRHKNGVEDLRKSIWYTEKLIAYLDAKSTQE